MSIQTTAPATIGSSRGHTTPASLAAALRHAAEQIEAIGAVELDPTILTVNLQVTTQAGTRETRIATVDALNVALTGVPGEHGEMDTQHSTPYSHHYGTHYDISVYAGLEDSKLNPNRKAAEAERAELIEQADAASDAREQAAAVGDLDTMRDADRTLTEIGRELADDAEAVIATTRDDGCPACGRLHFPWCHPDGGPGYATRDGSDR